MLGERINEGDDVLLYLTSHKTYLVKVERGKRLHTHKGYVNLEELIGKQYGAQILSNKGVEFYALKPTPRDYAFKMQRKTQINYPKDIGLIVIYSGIGPGSRVLEAGTGTGALTSILAHFVKPTGRVYSYDVRLDHLEVAKENLSRAGVLEYVSLKNKDVTEGIDEKDIDAVILDMPTPWLVVKHAYSSLKGSGAFIAFIPTIEQVIKTVETLRENWFVDVETFETLLRGIQVAKDRTRPQTFMTGHTGYIVKARKALPK
ncbi:tRNA (adenine-N1)-methyltransferase [Candidatus Bathyarchaeota archaeon]|nr:MAG: tRNA (adenine-N1)-methyltransferase [Candidatus Bathyarchaeota archaeon]HDN63029.1 tRNA (adenine-N1)-methyltransferase [Candidatus Bathyarchaeota archaeon]